MASSAGQAGRAGPAGRAAAAAAVAAMAAMAALAAMASLAASGGGFRWRSVLAAWAEVDGQAASGVDWQASAATSVAVATAAGTAALL